MAITTLSITNNRYGLRCTLRGTVASVALDASAEEDFILPTGFGEFFIEAMQVSTTMSGAYVAPAPAQAGFGAFIKSADGSTFTDVIGPMLFINRATSGGQPLLESRWEFFHRIYLRSVERISVQLPIIGGGGVTGTIACNVRGMRLYTT